MNSFTRSFAVGAVLLLLGVSSLFAQSFVAGPFTPATNLQGLGFTLFDADNNGTLDIFIEPNNLLINTITNGTASFAAVTSGVPYQVNMVGSIAADFDGDGYPDLLTTQGSNRPLLYSDSAGVVFTNYKGNLGDFASISAGNISSGQLWGICAADYNRDGYLDIMWAGLVSTATQIRLLKGGAAGFSNVGGATSTDPTSTVAIDTTRRFEAWNPAFVDANGDGYPDIFLPSIRNGLSTTGTGTGIAPKGSILYINNGDGTFSVPAGNNAAGVADTGIIVDDTVRHYSGVASAWGDFDNDGIMDLAISPLSNEDGSGKVNILKGLGNGKFTYVHTDTVTYNSSSRGIAWADMDNDGYLDLVQDLGFGGYTKFWKNNGDGTFTDATSTWGMPTSGMNSRSANVGDFNNDGFLDVYMVAGGSDTIRMNTPNSNNWIAFRPIGTVGTNTSAIGARFTLYTQGGTFKQTRYIEAGGSGGCTNGAMWANFGIGTSTKIDSISVVWPDGKWQSFKGLAINKYWTVKEGSVIPETPVQTSPANNATDQPTSVTLQWGAATGALAYQIQVSLDPTFADNSKLILNDSLKTATIDTVSGLGYSTTYYWRVKAFNAGFYSAFSAVDTFTTQIVPATEIPNLASPVNGATNQASSLKLVINKTSDAAQYHWQVSTDAAFASFAVNDSTIDTTQTVKLVAATKYFWRVQGVNPGGASAFSAVDTFTTMAVPASAPVMVYPFTNGTNVRNDTLILKWKSVATASGYICQISPRTGFDSLVVSKDTVTDTTITAYSMKNLAKYYWRIMAFNIGGNSAYSAIDSFTTWAPVPAAPTLTTPSSNATSVSRIPKFIWKSVTYAQKYHLQVATDNLLTAIVLDTLIAGDTSAVSSITLDANTKFYWHVSAKDTAGESAYSSSKYFTTGTTNVDGDGSAIPKEFALHQNYPNPFNPTTMIAFDLPKDSHVKILIYDVLGRVVATLVDGVKPASSYTVQWNASRMSSGVYICRIQAESEDHSQSFTSVKKLLLMK